MDVAYHDASNPFGCFTAVQQPAWCQLQPTCSTYSSGTSTGFPLPVAEPRTHGASGWLFTTAAEGGGACALSCRAQQRIQPCKPGTPLTCTPPWTAQQPPQQHQRPQQRPRRRCCWLLLRGAQVRAACPQRWSLVAPASSQPQTGSQTASHRASHLQTAMPHRGACTTWRHMTHMHRLVVGRSAAWCPTLHMAPWPACFPPQSSPPETPVAAAAAAAAAVRCAPCAVLCCDHSPT